ncbi:MAG: hypothetical protein HZB26_26685 [Candidatus Hydrogenedentes bacterium]|nr:hypothetical protein [Candidatus Hydrogenedentota bacterium]
MKSTTTILWKLTLVLVPTFAPLLSEAYGSVLPQFFFEASVHKATHVVLASEGEKLDGILNVIECWKGDLRPGDVIEIPELAEFSSKELRTISREAEVPQREAVTGNRMILFLVKSLDWADDRSDKLRTKWLPANSHTRLPPANAYAPSPRDRFEEMRISVAWLEDGRAYVFAQVSSPGPLVLTNTGLGNEEEIRRRVKEHSDDLGRRRQTELLSAPKEHLKQAKELAREHPERAALAASEPDPIRRAEALVPFLRDDNRNRCEETYNAMAECGVPAIAHLRSMLDDKNYGPWSDLIMRSLAKAKGSRR